MAPIASASPVLNPTGPLMTDADLVLAAQRGDGEALATLFQRHGGVARGVAGRLVGCHADVDDAVAEAFTNVFEHLGGLRRPECFRAYLLTCVRNAAHDRRRRALQLQDAPPVPDDHPPARPVEPVEAAVEAADEAARLAAAVAELPSRQRYALRRFYWDEAPVAGIAGELGLSVNATTQLLFRARAGLAARTGRPCRRTLPQ